MFTKVFTKEFDDEFIEIAKDRLLEAAIEIWMNRAAGKEDDRPCPCCMMKDILETLGRIGAHCECDKSNCILGSEKENEGGCFETPFGVWDEVTGWNSFCHEGKEAPMTPEEAAQHMVNMLVAYRDADMETFEKYLHFYKDTFGEIQ